jgi:hemerythrin-like domain-containing protein
VQKYVTFYLEHMHLEETIVLPLAERALGVADWAELDAAFLANRDPLAGHEADEPYRPLFRKILRLLPGSSSIGSALEALAGSAIPKQRLPP